MIFSALRFCVSIAWDASEALADWLNCNRAVDSLWAQQHTEAAARLADAEAEHEFTGPRVCVCGSTSCLALSESTNLAVNRCVDPDHSCWCARCNPGAWWMVTCADCGSKRCPRAMWHEQPCNHGADPLRGFVIKGGKEQIGPPGTYQSSSTAGVAPNPAVEDAPRQEFPPGVGHPNLTPDDLYDAEFAARSYAFRRCSANDNADKWNALAAKRRTAANNLT